MFSHILAYFSAELSDIEMRLHLQLYFPSVVPTKASKASAFAFVVPFYGQHLYRSFQLMVSMLLPLWH